MDKVVIEKEELGFDFDSQFTQEQTKAYSMKQKKRRFR